MKHAVMIMAHNNFEQLEYLIRQLDSQRIDIFLHIDKKVGDFSKENILSWVSFSKVYFVQRVNVGYCDHTMLDAVKNLLLCATYIGYDYYHMISGADMLIKPLPYFFDFFEKNAGKEFVGFAGNVKIESYLYKRFFTKHLRDKNKLSRSFYLRLDKFLIFIQKAFGIKNKKVLSFKEVKKGADWWSVTHNAAIYALENADNFQKCFKGSFCPTEFFMQTLLWNSEFKNNLYSTEDECESHRREIDWNRGTPYVWRESDFDYLVSSDKLFARKFDLKTDSKIIEKIFEYTKQNS